MKMHNIVSSLFLFCFSCQEAEPQKEGINERLQYRISMFYTTGKGIEDYTPIYYSSLDTIKKTVLPSGERISTTGVLLHKYEARNKGGELQVYQDSIEVELFEDGTIIALPKKYITGK